VQTLTFVLSVLGFALALFQSWHQLQAFSRKVAASAETYAVRRLKAVNRRADFYIDFPSAFIAVLFRNIIVLAAFLTIRSMLIDSADDNGFYDGFLPPFFAFLVAFLFGKVIADSFLLSKQIVRRAQQRFFSSEREG